MDIRVRPGRRVVNGWREYEVVSEGETHIAYVSSDGLLVDDRWIGNPVKPRQRLSAHERAAVLACAEEFEG